MVYCYLTRAFSYWKTRNFPGPRPLLLFGDQIQVLRKMNIGVVFEEIYDKFPYEKVVSIYRMATPSLLLCDWELIKHVLNKDFDCFSDRGVSFSVKGLGNNLFHTASGRVEEPLHVDIHVG
ncbi:unnamed protein product, partial [Iphiclides podalirius]